MTTLKSLNKQIYSPNYGSMVSDDIIRKVSFAKIKISDTTQNITKKGQ
jgi:hypothetical protein